MRQVWLGRALVLLSLIVIAAATLTPDSAAPDSESALCIVCSEYGTVDLFLNVLLFLPLGVGLRLSGIPTTWTVALVVLATLGIELLQFDVVPGRDASLGDLVANSLGGWLGCILVASAGVLLAPSPRAARRLAGGGALVWLVVLAITSWALRPLVVPAPTYIFVAPYSPHLPGFSGRVVAARVDGRVPPAMVNGESAEVPYAGGGLTVFEVTAIVGAASPDGEISAIVAVMNAAGHELSLVGEWHHAFLFRPHMRASRLHLRTPAVILPMSGLGGGVHPGDTVHLSARRGGGALHLAGTAARPDGHATAAARLALRSTLGWSLLLPWDGSIWPGMEWLTALWVAAPAIWVGYFSAIAWRTSGSPGARPAPGARSHRLRALLPSAALVLGLVLAGPLAGISPPVWWEGVVLLAGLAAGGGAFRYVGSPGASGDAGVRSGRTRSAAGEQRARRTSGARQA